MQTVENSNSYRKVYMFANGYGASIISSDCSYGGRCGQGLFEVAVLDRDGNLCYDTPVTNDVVGWLDFAGVADILKQIENL